MLAAKLEFLSLNVTSLVSGRPKAHTNMTGLDNMYTYETCTSVTHNTNLVRLAPVLNKFQHTVHVYSEFEAGYEAS